MKGKTANFGHYLPSTLLKIVLPVVVLLSGMAAAWAIVANRPSLESRPPQAEIPSAKVLRIEPQTLRLNVHSQGVVAPRTEIDLVPEVAGKVTQLHPSFVAGGFFAEGDVLVRIDPRDYDYAVAETLARIAEAKRQLALEEAQVEQAHNEWRALGEGEPTPLALHQPQLAEARAKLKAAEADLAKAQLKRGRCELRAPFAGRVHDKRIGLGQYIQAGEKLARLYSIDVAEVRLPLAADQLAYIDLPFGYRNSKAGEGPQVTLTAEFAGAARRWEGRIVRTEGALDEANGLLYAVAEVRDPYAFRENQPPLLAGLFVHAEIEGRQLPGLFVLPQSAVSASQEALSIDAEERLHIHKLEILRSEPDRVLVKGGLAAGEQIVTGGIPIPVEGMRVKAED